MSDRFYKQACEFYDVSPWEYSYALSNPESEIYSKLVRKSMPKVTRKELSNQFKELTNSTTDISKLSLATALEVVEFFKKNTKVEINMPEGRKKDPYILELQKHLGRLDFSTATVVVMKGILESMGDKK